MYIKRYGEVPYGKTVLTSIYTLPESMSEGCTKYTGSIDELQPVKHKNKSGVYNYVAYIYSDSVTCADVDQVRNIQAIGANFAVSLQGKYHNWSWTDSTTTLDINIPSLKVYDYDTAYALNNFIHSSPNSVVHAKLTFPDLSKTEVPSYTIVVNNMTFNNATFMQKWIRVFNMIKNDTKFDLIFYFDHIQINLNDKQQKQQKQQKRTLEEDDFMDASMSDTHCYGKYCYYSYYESQNATGKQFLDSYILQMCYIDIFGYDDYFNYLDIYYEKNLDQLNTNLPNFIPDDLMPYIKDKIDECYNNSFTKTDGTEEIENYYLSKIAEKRKILDYYYEPIYYVEGKQIGGNFYDINNLFLNICDSFELAKPYCSIDVNDTLWIVGDEIWNDDQRTWEFNRNISSNEGLSMLALICAVMLISIVAIAYFYYCYLRSRIQNDITKTANTKINEYYEFKQKNNVHNNK